MSMEPKTTENVTITLSYMTGDDRLEHTFNFAKVPDQQKMKDKMLDMIDGFYSYIR